MYYIWIQWQIISINSPELNPNNGRTEIIQISHTNDAVFAARFQSFAQYSIYVVADTIDCWSLVSSWKFDLFIFLECYLFDQIAKTKIISLLKKMNEDETNCWHHIFQQLRPFQQRNATIIGDVIAPTLFICINNKVITQWIISIHTTHTKQSKTTSSWSGVLRKCSLYDCMDEVITRIYIYTSE